jgi:proline dehydrogenase
MLSFDNTKIAFKQKTNKELNKSYLLFQLIANNTLVKIGPSLLKFALFLKLPITGIIKKTIFQQFCGGESIDTCNKTIDNLDSYNIGTILDYSVEGKNNESDFNRVYEEAISTIKVAQNNKKIPFTVFKISGLASLQLLEKWDQNESNFSEKEKKEFHSLKNKLDKLCELGKKLDVKIFIDAEESWIQDCIDFLVTELMSKYNKEKVLVYNTLQMYRWDRLNYLYSCHENAMKNNYLLGFKIVRGAYMEKERERAKELNYPSPIQKDKLSSDKDYDLALEYCVKNIETIAICAGTHNEKSSLFLSELMKEHNLINAHPHIYYSQLLGMSDHISFNLSNLEYNVAKYVPYGPVRDVIPYLIRRAQENTSISGQTSRELNLIIQEKKRRKSN